MTIAAVPSALDQRAVQGKQQKIEEAFPDIDPGARPYGDRVLVQLRTPKRFSAGGIALPGESRDQEKWVTTVAKVVSLGPLAFKDRRTMTPWPEGVWAEVGQFVRVPKFGGDRWEILLDPDNPDSDSARFCIYRDTELNAAITGDPLAFRDYV